MACHSSSYNGRILVIVRQGFRSYSLMLPSSTDLLWCGCETGLHVENAVCILRLRGDLGMIVSSTARIGADAYAAQC